MHISIYRFSFALRCGRRRSSSLHTNESSTLIADIKHRGGLPPDDSVNNRNLIAKVQNHTMRLFYNQKRGTNTAKRRICQGSEFALILVSVFAVCLEIASAFMSPRINNIARRPAPSRLMSNSLDGYRIQGTKLSGSHGLFASVASEQSSKTNGETQDVIMTSTAPSDDNDTVPYFMSIHDTLPIEAPLFGDEKINGQLISQLDEEEVKEWTHTVADQEQLQPKLYPSIAISYDAYGMVQADATLNGSTLDKGYNSEDYPALIKFLYSKDVNGQTVVSKLFNFALLAVSFSYVFFSVFNIDKGMTRGWTPGEISLRIPLDTWASYENSLSEKPVATKTIINVVIYLLGDWLSQTLFQGKNILDFDAARTIKNGVIGMCFGPAVHEYYEFSDWILPVDGATFGVTNRAFKILMDQTIYLATKCSIYIIAIGVLNGDTLANSTDNVKNRLKPIMFAAWKFWPLVHCVTYGLIPARHRILWVNSGK